MGRATGNERTLTGQTSEKRYGTELWTLASTATSDADETVTDAKAVRITAVSINILFNFIIVSSFQFFTLEFFTAAAMKSRNNGWGFTGRDRNSGWN